MSQLPRTEIVGFSLEGPAPVGQVHIAWQSGISVLYGSNGSGKTTILSGIEKAVKGISAATVDRPSAHGFLHVRLIDWDKPLVGDANAGKSFEAYRRSRSQRRFNVGDELAGSIIDNLMAAIRRPQTSFDRWRIDESGIDIVRKLDALEDGEAGSAPIRLLRAFVSVDDDNPYLTFSATGSDDADARRHVMYLGHPRGEGPDSESREVSLKYEYLRHRVETQLTEVVDEERSEAVVRQIAEHVRDEIEQGGIAMDDVDLDYAVLCLEYTYRGKADLGGADEFWTNYQGFAGVSEGGLQPLFSEALLAPAWVPIAKDSSVIDGHFDGLPSVVSSSASAVKDIYEKSVNVHRSIAGIKGASPDEMEEVIGDTQDTVMERANEVRSLLFPDLPELTWRPGTAAEWIEGHPFVWEALDNVTGQAIPISQLSEAQQRWAGLVLALNRQTRDIVLIDEPELGLHQKAAARTGRRLAEFAEAERIPVILASHSAEFLALDRAHLHHVHRRPRDGASAVVPVDRGEIGTHAETLDLSIPDLLQFIRTWVVVEGEHDRALIDALVGPELRTAGAEIVTMRGAKQAVTLADAEVLYKYTDANVLLVLDAIDDVAAVREMWMKATAAARNGRTSEAIGAISSYRQSHRDPNYEERQLLAFAQQAIGLTDPSRVRLFGFKAKDIIEYVPPSHFGLKASWAELRDEYEKDLTGKTDFKRWLKLRRQAHINVDLVRSGAERIEPEDVGEFTELLNLVAD